MSAMLPDWLTHRARSLPRAPALVSGRRRLDYAVLHAHAARQAHALMEAGVGHGDRVAVIAGTSPAFVAVMHAASLAGAVFAPFNTRLTAGELAEQLGNADPAIMLHDRQCAALAAEATALAGLPAPRRLPLPPASREGALAEAHDADDCHSIVHTSGTAGRAKGVMLTYGGLWASASASALNLGLDPADRWLACLPFHHVGGLSIPIRGAIYGTAVELHAGFDAAAVNAALRADEVTLVSLVPTMLRRMLDADGEPFGGSVRAALVGGGPVPPALLERAAARGLPVVQTYGLTETASQVTTLSPREGLSRLGSAGRPLLSAEVRVDAPAGEPGEILVRGPTVTPGYFRDAGATAAAIRDGWLHTADLGVLDGDGYLTVLDRRDDVIVTGGENVYPGEVEAALLAAPGVEAAAVVGLPDEEWGQRVAAAVVCAGPVDRERLGPFLRGRLAGYKHPAVIERVEAIPATASGKVRRRLVRELLAERLAGGREPAERSLEPGGAARVPFAPEGDA